MATPTRPRKPTTSRKSNQDRDRQGGNNPARRRPTTTTSILRSCCQDIKADIDKTKTVKDLTDLMNSKDMKDDLKKLSKEEEADAKAYATNHLKDNLGWVAPSQGEANG